MLDFQTWLELNENLGREIFKNIMPHHTYKTKDGHRMSIHLMNNELGQHAVHYNDNLKAVTRLTYWDPKGKRPSKKELEKMGVDDNVIDNIVEQILLERAAHKDLGSDAAGKITEHSATMHLINHAHAQAGTAGTAAHKRELDPHKKAIETLSKGRNPEQVALRMHHGKIVAGAIINASRAEHGPNSYISRAGQTSKSGDIKKFTNGKHEDGQENPSDVSVEVKNSDKSKNGDSQYSGYSVKSSGKSNVITAKNPAIHVDGVLDHPTRKLETDRVSREELAKVHKKLGVGGKSAADRRKMIEAARKKEKKKDKEKSSLEIKANELAKPSKEKVAKEFHDHLTHLTTNVGDEGHHMIGKMLSQHLTAKTSMPWSKIHVKGSSPDRTSATVTPGSDSPLSKIFKDKRTRYAVTRTAGSARVTIHKKEKDGSLTAIAHYTPKTKSNAFKENVHGWNVTPASH